MVVGLALALILPKCSPFCGGIHFRNVRSHNKLEFCWTVVPMFILIFMGYPSFVQLYGIGMNDKPKLVRVKATGHQ